MLVKSIVTFFIDLLTPCKNVHSLAFSYLGLDLIGLIRPVSNGYIWIITVTEYFTKWVESDPLKNATGAIVANFIQGYLVFRFEIESDNGILFVNKQVHSTLVGYRIKHQWSMPYNPQGNGQAEATNKTLIRILRRMVHEYEGI